MITKGYIEEVVDKYTYKVRLPTLDNVKQPNIRTVDEDLPSASVCSQLNCDLNLQVGDVVFVGFEDNSRYKPVILGCLSSDFNNLSRPNINFNTLTVTGTAKLSKDTSIGDVSYKNLQCLIGLSDNAQKQLNSKIKDVEKIKASISSISKNLNGIKAQSNSQLIATKLNSDKIKAIQDKIGKDSSDNINTVNGSLNKLSEDIPTLLNSIGYVPKDTTIAALIDDLMTRINKLKLNTSNDAEFESIDLDDQTYDSYDLAGTAEFKAIIAVLRKKFPHGKYWNHSPKQGTGYDLTCQDRYTSTPCPKHNGYCGTSKQTCNGYAPNGHEISWQCMGYADKCGYDVTGYDPHGSKWKLYEGQSAKIALDHLKPGDIIRYKNGSHSIYVTDVNNDIITYTDCNSDGACVIRWDATISKNDVLSTLSHIRSSPTDLSKSRLLKANN